MLALCEVGGMVKVAQISTSPAALVLFAQYFFSANIWEAESWSSVRRPKTSPRKTQVRFQGTLGEAHSGSSFLKPSEHLLWVIGTDWQEDNEETGLYQPPIPLGSQLGLGVGSWS